MNTNNNIFEQEKRHLNNVIQNIEQEKKDKELELVELPKKYRSDPFLLQDLMSIVATRITRLNNVGPKPYFARIDFHENGKNDIAKIYIGKTGVYDHETNMPVVIDWRAPICTLYYDSNLGKVQYNAPGGIYEGELNLKRQILIENGEIIDIFDVDSVSDDELLKPYLKANADGRLKNIIASIQKEQNQIIRSSFSNNMVVQGVAGSGKTTVALHRVAYLMYNENKKIKPGQFLVIGPNKFFMDYISSVLPDLESEQASQFTFEEIALKFLNEKFSIGTSAGSIAKYINTGKIDKTLKFKNSLNYKDAIDLFLNDFENEILNKSFSIDGIKILDSKEILDKYKESQSSTSFYDKIEMIKIRIQRKIKDNPEEYIRIIKAKFTPLYSKYEMGDPRRMDIYKAMDSYEKEIRTGCAKELKKHFSAVKNPILSIYKNFINNIDKYCDDKFVNIEEFKKSTLFNLTKKTVEFEDLSAMMYLKLKLAGNSEFRDYAHVVIDESQDFGIFQFLVLKELLNKSSFSIFGDLAQAIYSYRSIDNWQDVCEYIFNSNCSILELNKSYRTTIEIMNVANSVINHLNMKEAEPVIRHGKNVEITEVNSDKNYLANKLKQLKESNFNSIAVICKSQEESMRVHEELNKSFINSNLIDNNSDKYTNGIYVAPCYLTKGLEFDAVIVNDASEKKYSSDNLIDMKLLYVALTRPLHYLEIMHDGEISKPLALIKNKRY